MITDLDSTLFDDELMEYLLEFLADYRVEVALGIIEFLVSVPCNGDKESHRRATLARIVSRAALLDRLLNKRKITAREIPLVYGVSVHLYYDTLTEVELELKLNNSSIREVISIK